MFDVKCRARVRVALLICAAAAVGVRLVPVYLIKPVPPVTDDVMARQFVCEDDPQALSLALSMARAGLTVEVWHGTRLVGCTRQTSAELS